MKNRLQSMVMQQPQNQARIKWEVQMRLFLRVVQDAD